MPWSIKRYRDGTRAVSGWTSYFMYGHVPKLRWMLYTVSSRQSADGGQTLDFAGVLLTKKADLRIVHAEISQPALTCCRGFSTSYMLECSGDAHGGTDHRFPLTWNSDLDWNGLASGDGIPSCERCNDGGLSTKALCLKTTWF
jgi:hypothetical protein